MGVPVCAGKHPVALDKRTLHSLYTHPQPCPHRLDPRTPELAVSPLFRFPRPRIIISTLRGAKPTAPTFEPPPPAFPPVQNHLRPLHRPPNTLEPAPARSGTLRHTRFCPTSTGRVVHGRPSKKEGEASKLSVGKRRNIVIYQRYPDLRATTTDSIRLLHPPATPANSPNLFQSPFRTFSVASPIA